MMLATVVLFFVVLNLAEATNLRGTPSLPQEGEQNDNHRKLQDYVWGPGGGGGDMDVNMNCLQSADCREQLCCANFNVKLCIDPQEINEYVLCLPDFVDLEPDTEDASETENTGQDDDPGSFSAGTLLPLGESCHTSSECESDCCIFHNLPECVREEDHPFMSCIGKVQTDDNEDPGSFSAGLELENNEKCTQSIDCLSQCCTNSNVPMCLEQEPNHFMDCLPMVVDEQTTSPVESTEGYGAGVFDVPNNDKCKQSNDCTSACCSDHNVRICIDPAMANPFVNCLPATVSD